jgi:predicted amidohydrolase YtcJ
LPLAGRLLSGAALLLIPPALLAAEPAAPANKPLLITPARVWTGEGAVHTDWSVLIVQNSIAAVGPTVQLSASADAQRIDLPDATLIPGLMDLHAHVLLHPYNETSWDDQVLKSRWNTVLCWRRVMRRRPCRLVYYFA